MRTCLNCCQEKPLTHEHFYSRQGVTQVIWSGKCRECIKAEKRAKYDPEKKRANDLKRFGLTIESFSEMLLKQDHKCAICGTSDANFSGGKRFHVDHCHKTNKVRGLLCGHCNVLLGHAKDDVEILQNAITYLNDSFDTNTK